MDGEMACRSKTPGFCARVARLHSTSGGRSDTDVKELIVNPAVRPSAQRAVTTATPVGKAPSARGIRAHRDSGLGRQRWPGDLSTQRSLAAALCRSFEGFASGFRFISGFLSFRARVAPYSSATITSPPKCWQAQTAS